MNDDFSSPVARYAFLTGRASTLMWLVACCGGIAAFGLFRYFTTEDPIVMYTAFGFVMYGALVAICLGTWAIVVGIQARRIAKKIAER